MIIWTGLSITQGSYASIAWSTIAMQIMHTCFDAWMSKPNVNYNCGNTRDDSCLLEFMKGVKIEVNVDPN